MESRAGGGALRAGRGSVGGASSRKGAAAEGRERPPWGLGAGRRARAGPGESAERRAAPGDQRVPEGRRESLLCLWTQQLPGSERASRQILGTKISVMRF